ncbi:MAG TPA: GTPase domain-containing protein [Candidatus Lokiarchaeia archaeon]|nr:GTPase domain-containing protein [Candidatus Lokiarchaeia archaeon]
MKKIVFIGPPNAGKTSLRKFFFEGVPADTILERSDAPTISTNYSRYNYVYSYPFEKDGGIPEKIPIEVTLLDTSGQELESLVTTKMRQTLFYKADIVLFIFDVSEWDDEVRREYLMDFISFANDARLEAAPDSTYHVIGHKYDRHPAGIDAIEKVRAAIKNDLTDFIFQKIGKLIYLSAHLTSLMNDYRRESFHTVLDLMMNLFSTSL